MPSAVLFGLNPTTGSRDEVVINASWGLGESIVGVESLVVGNHWRCQLPAVHLA